MIRLIDLLKEAQGIPETVYHFTLPKYFVNMVKTNTIKADPKFKQISFTADPDLWAFREFADEDQEIGIRIEFDSDKLPPLTPFTYPGHPDDDYTYEQEYITKAGDIRPSNIMNLIKSITAQSYWKPYLQEHLPENIFKEIEFV